MNHHTNAAILSVFLSGAVAYRRDVSVAANPYKSTQFWNAWSDGWRACKARPGARRVDLVRAFRARGDSDTRAEAA
jgi:hypothetical protein